MHDMDMVVLHASIVYAGGSLRIHCTRGNSNISPHVKTTTYMFDGSLLEDKLIFMEGEMSPTLRALGYGYATLAQNKIFYHVN